MKKAPSHTSLSNVHSETQKLRRQNANVLRSQSVRCLISHVVVEFPNSRHMYALRTYFLLSWSDGLSCISAHALISAGSFLVISCKVGFEIATHGNWTRWWQFVIRWIWMRVVRCYPLRNPFYSFCNWCARHCIFTPRKSVLKRCGGMQIFNVKG